MRFSEHPLANAKCDGQDADYPLITLQGQFTGDISVGLHNTMRELDLNPNATVTFISWRSAWCRPDWGQRSAFPTRLRSSTNSLTCGCWLPDLRFYIFTRNGRSLSPAAEAFRNHLSQHIENAALCSSMHTSIRGPCEGCLRKHKDALRIYDRAFWDVVMGWS